MLKLYKRIFTNSKYSRLIIVLFIVLIVGSNILTSITNAYFSGSKSGFYKLGNVTIPSVESVVGNREFNLIYKDRAELRYSYTKVKNPLDDVNKYIKYLTDECGYDIIAVSDGYRVLKENTETNIVIVIDITVDKSSYEIFARKGVS